MPKLTLISSFPSSIVIGDPGIVTYVLAPKETKVVDVTDVHLRQLKEQLEKLSAAGWLRCYTEADPITAPLFAAPPIVAPAPVLPATAPVPVVPVIATVPVVPIVPVEPGEPPVVPAPEVTPEPVVAAPAVEGVASTEAVPAAPKVQFFGKGRNR